MLTFIQEVFQYRFLSNALLAALLTGLSCGIVGTYIVSRRLVFLSGGITHASFGGIGLAYYLGLNPIAGAMVFAVLSALSIDLLSGRSKVREDSAIGILWALGMAAGIVFIYMTPGYTPNLMSFLFGNILTVTDDIIRANLVLDIVLVGVLALMYRPILYVSFDREYARTQKVKTRLVNNLMLVLVAATIVLTIRLVGIMLLVSLLTIPPVIANLFTRSYKKITWTATALASGAGVTGLYISYHTNFPSGATIILVLGGVFLLLKLGVWLLPRRESGFRGKRRPK